MIHQMRKKSLALLLLLGVLCHHVVALTDFSSNVLLPKTIQLRGGGILSPTPVLPVTEEQKVLMELIAGENGIIDTRMNWFLTFQGFLFAALSFSKDQDLGNSALVSLMIPAAVSCLSLLIVVLDSDRTLLQIKNVLTHQTLKELCDAPTAGRFFGVAFTELFRPKYSMPLSILAAWGLVMVKMSSEGKEKED